ncbi:MAG: YlxR family protein [Anaerolineaceae bacterium]
MGCRLVQPKRSLIRIVSSPQGVRIDPSGKAAGRGAYLHNSRSCWKKGLNGKLAQALKVEISAEDRASLSAFQETLPVDEEGENSVEVTLNPG